MVAPKKHTPTRTFHMMSPPKKKLVTHQQKSSKQITKIEIYKHFSDEHMIGFLVFFEELTIRLYV